MNRKTFIKTSALTGAAFIVSKYGIGRQNTFPTVRVPIGERRFTSPAVEALISQLQKNIPDQETGWLFGNCFPNTLDTTVDFSIINGKPDTYVITGDIDAMWLRDSTAQVWPYLPLMKADKNLKALIKGVINRQTKCILLDPYANAFYKDDTQESEWKHDLTAMKPGIHERKWEIDSLCYPIRLAHAYWQQSGGDTEPFDNDWLQAMHLVMQTFNEQQRMEDKGPYTFQRTTAWATDGVPLSGYGYPTRANGLIHSMFRPSDDATVFPFLIPSNYFAATVMGSLAEMLKVLYPNHDMEMHARLLQSQIKKGIAEEGIIKHYRYGKIIAFEVNGLGSVNLMDDANVPSLLSLPYLGAIAANDPVYLNTRKIVLSENNPFFYKGLAAEGIGGPHTGANTIWPMSITLRGITATQDAEIKNCIAMLRKTHAGTGFMHESFDKDDASKFTRKWFAWANTLYGEFIWKVYRERKALLA